MFKKRIELIEKIEEIRNDVTNYLDEYVLALLKNHSLAENEIYIPFVVQDFEDRLENVQVDKVDVDGKLFLLFEYDGGEFQSEEMELERLSFEALISLVEQLEPLTE